MTCEFLSGQGVYVYSIRIHPPPLYTQTFEIISFHLYIILYYIIVKEKKERKETRQNREKTK